MIARSLGPAPMPITKHVPWLYRSREMFIRAVAAYDVSCLMEYKGMSLQEAMAEVVHHKMTRIHGEGGMIGVDARGNTAMLFNSAGMYRAMKHSNGDFSIGIYKD